MRSRGARPAVLAGTLHLAENSLGTLAVGVGGAFAWVCGLLLSTHSWVTFFLLSKPLVDLTWRWEFLNVFNQRVNPQAILAVLASGMNCLVALLGRRKPRYSGRVLLLLAVATISVILTPSSWGVNELLRLFSGVSFFFTAGLALGDQKRFHRFSIVFLVILCVPLVLSLLQVAGFLPFEYWDWLENHEVGRASGTYQHPLEVIFFLVYAVPLGLYRLENSGSATLERAFLLIFSILAFAGLIFTFHRVGWVAIVLEVAIWFGLKKQVKRILLSAVVVALLVAVFSDWVSLLYQPAAEIVSGQTDFASGDFLRGRGVNWAVFLASYAQGGPLRWVVGRGGSVVDASVGAYSNFAENEPHNDFIRLLHAYGLAGLLLYFSFLLLFFRKGLRLKRSRVPFHSGVGRILSCCLVGVFLLSLTAEPMRYPTAIWYLFALGSVAMILEQDLNASAPNGRSEGKEIVE